MVKTLPDWNEFISAGDHSELFCRHAMIHTFQTIVFYGFIYQVHEIA